jgi:hypothetical protein
MMGGGGALTAADEVRERSKAPNASELSVLSSLAGVEPTLADARVSKCRVWISCTYAAGAGAANNEAAAPANAVIQTFRIARERLFCRVCRIFALPFVKQTRDDSFMLPQRGLICTSHLP